MDVSDEQRVIAAATMVAGGDSSRVHAWYFQEKLLSFAGKTAAELVAEGRVEDLLRYLESIEQGPAG